MRVYLFRGALGAVTLAALVMTGCGGRVPPTTDLAQARTALTTALDAWKAGTSPEKLREQSPPIDFRDTNWEKGSKLTKYEIDNEQQFGPSAKFTVKLHLTEKTGGGERSRTVTYSVDHGQLFVIRPEF